jgi:hypothetical protein
MAQMHDATHQPTASSGAPWDVITLPDNIDSATRERWLDLFTRSGATQAQIDRTLEWYGLLQGHKAEATAAAEDARQVILDSRSERHARELSRALSVKRLSGQKLSPTEDSDLKEAYQQLAALQPPGSPPRYDHSRGW